MEAPGDEKYGKCSNFSKSRKMVQKHSEGVKKHRKGSGSRNQALQQKFAVQETRNWTRLKQSLSGLLRRPLPLGGAAFHFTEP